MAEIRLTQTEASLNPPSEKMVKVKINGTEIEVPNGENIIESAKRLGIDIPYFCYHPRLSKGDAANCRMCLVECATTNPDGTTRRMPKPQAACTMPASEGLVVETETERIVKDRKGVLEFLLINHPLDCPVCDRGGECPLQNNTLFYGPPTSRFIEEKRHFPKAYPLSEHVVFDRERCIHCARCTRFTEDISGDTQLGFLKRGADMEVGTFAQTRFQSLFSGNVIELCPVGALLSRTYRFKARPWDLMTQKSVCTRCSNGCNIKIDYRMDRLVRINARLNEEVNEEWTCDKGKFGHDYVSTEDRLVTALLKTEEGMIPVEWRAAYAAIVEKIKAAEGRVGFIGGERSTNEDNFVMQRFAREVVKTNNLDFRLDANLGATNNVLYQRLGYHGMGSTIADLEKAKTIFVLGSELSQEQPILFLRVRKAWRFKSAAIINANSARVEDITNVGDFANVNLIYKSGTEVALLNGLLHVLFREGSLSVENLDLTPLRLSVADWTPGYTARETGVSSEDIVSAAEHLAKGNVAILAGKAISQHPYADDIIHALANLAIAVGCPNSVNLPGEEVNTQGAMDMGITPDCTPGYKELSNTGMNTQQMLAAAAEGKLDVLWIHETRLVEKYHDPELVVRALENCPFVVVNDHFFGETAGYADVVLPIATFAEKDGTFTSCERRVQRIYKAFELSPDIKPAWLVFTEVASLLGGMLPYFSARDILKDIAAKVPQYAGITPKSLGEAGIRWNYHASEGKSIAIHPVSYKAPAKETATV